MKIEFITINEARLVPENGAEEVLLQHWSEHPMRMERFEASVFSRGEKVSPVQFYLNIDDQIVQD